MLVTCPGCAWGQHKASVKPAQDSGGEKTIHDIIRDPRLPRGCLHPPRIPPQNNIVCFAKQLFRIIILLTLCSVYTGLCVCLYARLYAVFMLFDYAKKGVFDDSFTLLLMLALCASSLCEQCFTFCFMLALCAIFKIHFFNKI